MKLDFVVHAPIPYRHRSAGFRALYILANELQEMGKKVALTPLPMQFLSEHDDPCPWELKSTDKFLPAEIRAAIHIVPEGVKDAPAQKSVRWLLGPHRYDNRDDFLEVDWLGQDAPRLCVDCIEPDLFYPKTDEGEGLLIWGGKYGPVGNDHFPGVTHITHAWPESRKELADALRGAEGVICYDPYTMLNLEATICGTPVLLAKGDIPDSMFANLGGIITDPSLFFEAREEAKGVAERYDEIRQLIANDVDDFVKLCEARW